MVKLLFLISILALFLISPAQAQTESQQPVPLMQISVDTAQNLRPITQIDFADYDLQVDSGQFAITDDGDSIAVPTADNRLFFFNAAGELLQTISLDAELVDGARAITSLHFVDDSLLLIVLESKRIAFLDLATYTIAEVRSVALQDQLIQAIWTDAEYIYSEVLLEDGTTRIQRDWFEDSEPFEQLPYPPASDETAVVRIGRIPPPYVVTSSLEGVVKLWDLATSEMLMMAENGRDEPSVFGAINHMATHFVWRDNANQFLFLLDFATGENLLVDELNGAYAQWLFLSDDASLIIAVNLDFEPNVVAWDVTSGERTILGEHRQCGRPQPDAAQLSADGTTLVIGCDAGLELWRVQTGDAG